MLLSQEDIIHFLSYKDLGANIDFNGVIHADQCVIPRTVQLL